MKIKVIMVSCSHETKHGVSHYSRLVKKNETPSQVIEEIAKECDYDENNEREYFDSNMEELIIDTDDYEIVEL